MSKIKCPQCGDRDVSITPYTPPDRDVASCRKCGYTSLAEDFPKQDLFDLLTSSHEVLAPEFVYCEKTLTDGDIWYSLLLGEVGYATEEEATQVTLVKLKEVCND